MGWGAGEEEEGGEKEKGEMRRYLFHSIYLFSYLNQRNLTIGFSFSLFFFFLND